MSFRYSTICSTCSFDLSEYFYKKIIKKCSIKEIEEDITQSCCRMCFRGQYNCVKLWGNK